MWIMSHYVNGVLWILVNWYETLKIDHPFHLFEWTLTIGAATARVGGVRTPQLLGLEHWTPPTVGILTWDPLWDPPMWPWSLMGPPKISGPPHGTLLIGPPAKFVTEKIENRVGKFDQLTPPRIYEPHRLPPPSKSSWKTPSTTPPLEFTNLIDYPPPLEIGQDNSTNYPPPSNLRTSSTTPPLEIDLDPPNFWSVAAPLTLTWVDKKYHSRKLNWDHNWKKTWKNHLGRPSQSSHLLKLDMEPTYQHSSHLLNGANPSIHLQSPAPGEARFVFRGQWSAFTWY